MILDKYKFLSIPIIRYGLALTILWFGIKQIIDTSWGISWLPSYSNIVPFSAQTIIYLNGIFEILIAIFLLLGLFTRTVSLLLCLHLLSLLFIIGYNEIAVRDFGLMAASLGIFFHGKDKLSIDNKLKKNVR